MGRVDQALKLFHEVIAYADKVEAPDVNLRRVLCGLSKEIAAINADAGQLQESERWYMKVLLDRAHARDSVIIRVDLLQRIAGLYCRMKQWTKVEKYAKEALDLYRASPPRAEDRRATEQPLLVFLANAAEGQGRMEEALK